MRKGAVIRFCAACVICITVLLYNISGIFEREEVNFSFPQNNFVLSAEEKEEETEKVTEKVPEKAPSTSTSSNKETTASKTEESVETSAKAIKGKILSQYISPYKATTSYNNVYLKNSTGLKIDLKQLLNSNVSFKIKKKVTILQ